MSRALAFRLILTLLTIATLWQAKADDPGSQQGTGEDGLPNVTSEDGIDRPGSDFWLIRMNGPAAFGPCASYCRSTPRCGAYTIVRPRAPGEQFLCYLKDRVPPAQPNSCCRSGVKEDWRPLTPQQLAADQRLRRLPNVGEAIPGRAPLPQGALQNPPNYGPISPLPPAPVTPAEPPFGTPIPGVTAIDGTDRPGSDYRRIYPVSNARACAQACASDQPRCRAYTYVRPGIQESEAVCYLKSAAPVETPNVCCLSGIVDGPGSNAQPGGGGSPTPDTPRAGNYARYTGRLEPPGNSLINQLYSGDPRWQGLSFTLEACEMACDNPARFATTGAETRRCIAYSFRAPRVPNVGTCTTYSADRPLVRDDAVISGIRR